MTQHSRAPFEQAQCRTGRFAPGRQTLVTPRVELPQRLLKVTRHPSLPTDGVAGPPWTRRARLNQPPLATGGRGNAGVARADNPSFLHAIAKELAVLRQESVSCVMEEASRLLCEAFVAVELAGSGPGGASSNEARRMNARRSG